MDVALALTLTAAGAFLFMEGSLYFKYQVAREDGNRLYFRVAAVGAGLYLTALILGAFALNWGLISDLDGYLINWITPLLKEHAGANAQAQAIITAGLSFVLGPALARVSNRLVDRDKALWKAVKDDDLEALLQTAVVEVKPIAATLSNNKVYVGFVISTFDPRRDRKMFTMLPLVSGFRAQDGKIHFTTYYDAIYRQLPEAQRQGIVQGDAGAGAPESTPDLEGMTLNDFRIVIPVDKTLGIGFFDLTVYAHFNHGNAAKS